MAISGVTPGGINATSQPPLSSISQHKHGGHQSNSMSNIDAFGSSVVSPPSSTGKVGSKINVTA
jgi:hypothetical protein